MSEQVLSSARQWVKSPATSPAPIPPQKKVFLKGLEKVGNNNWMEVGISSNSLSTLQLVLKNTHTQKGLILYVLIFFSVKCPLLFGVDQLRIFLITFVFKVRSLVSHIKCFNYFTFFFLSACSQPLVPRESITAWMNAIGLIITALPVSS